MTEIWWWPVPREGEIVPDYPPVELTGYLATDGIVLGCGECYDIAHDEMDERETCDEHADLPDEP